MKRSIYFLGIALLITACMSQSVPSANAGRTGGPVTTMVLVPATQAIYFDVPFNVNELAVVSIRGTGRSMMQVNIYDTDGNIAIGDGYWDRVTASMAVYRAGLFRIEIVNMGSYDNTAVLTIN